MAELPEILIISRQMNQELAGRRLEALSLGQPKSLDRPPADFEVSLVGRRLDRVRGHGKWLILEFAPPGPNLLVNPGMGMDLLSLAVQPTKKPQFVFNFSGKAGFSLRFWWFGYLRLAEPGQEWQAMGRPGPAALSPEFTPQVLDRLLERKKKTGLKSFLLDQKNIAGIGNVYVQEICFKIKAHPRTRLERLTEVQRAGLFAAIQETLAAAVARGINHYEFDFLGRRGDWGLEAFSVGYKAGSACPHCQTSIIKIKSGASASYICPVCQPEASP